MIIKLYLSLGLKTNRKAARMTSSNVNRYFGINTSLSTSFAKLLTIVEL